MCGLLLTMKILSILFAKFWRKKKQVTVAIIKLHQTDNFGCIFMISQYEMGAFI